MWVRSLGQEDPLEEEMATHSSILAWKIPWMEEPDWLQSMGPRKVGHDRAPEHSTHRWLKATETYSLRVLEADVWNQNVDRAMLPQKALEKNPSLLASLSCWGVLAVLGSPWLVDTSVQSVSIFTWLCLSLSMSVCCVSVTAGLLRRIPFGFRDRLNWSWPYLTISALILFTTEVTFWSSLWIWIWEETHFSPVQLPSVFWYSVKRK